MTNVLEIFGLRATAGQIGIEVEVEGNNLPMPGCYQGFNEVWNVEGDGSLRGPSAEYVLRRPVSLTDVPRVMSVLGHAFHSNNATRDDSVRTGVHIHINCQDLTMTQVFTFVTCYIILEKLLVGYCGPTRQGNLFCLRAMDAEYLMYSLAEAARTKDYRIITNDNVRYAAINLKSLAKFGSVEFRSLDTPQDLSRITVWAEILHSIKENSLRFNSPRDVVLSMSDVGGLAFMSRMLGQHAHLFEGDDVEDMVYEGVRYAQDLAFATDWHTFEEQRAHTGGLRLRNRPRYNEDGDEDEDGEFDMDGNDYDEPPRMVTPPMPDDSWTISNSTPTPTQWAELGRGLSTGVFVGTGTTPTTGEDDGS